MVNKIQYPNLSHGNDFPCLLFMNSVLRSLRSHVSKTNIKNPGNSAQEILNPA